MSMTIKSIEDYYRDHFYAIPFEILLLSKSSDTQETFRTRRENNLKLL